MKHLTKDIKVYYNLRLILVVLAIKIVTLLVLLAQSDLFFSDSSLFPEVFRHQRPIIQK